MTRQFTKRYPDNRALRRAESNYWWLAGLGSPLLVPELLASTRFALYFEYIDGRHVRPGDLTMLSAHLGMVHGTACTRELRKADLCQPFCTANGHVIPGFPGKRTGGHSPSEIATASGLLRACLPSTPIMRILRAGPVRRPVGAAGPGGRSPSVIVRGA
jgi:hypothetical protein